MSAANQQQTLQKIMSTKIFDAWRIPTQSISELVRIGQTVRDFCVKPLAEEISGAIIRSGWNTEAISILQQSPNATGVLSTIPRTLISVFQRHLLSPTWIATVEVKEDMKNALFTQLWRAEFSLSSEEREAMESLLIEIYEQLSLNGNPTLTFMEGDNGSTYVKGFQLTDAARRFLDEKFQRFEYTDQCEMWPSAFDEEVREKWNHAESYEAADKILSQAQAERGAYWDAVFELGSKWSDVGLSFNCGTDFGVTGLSYVGKKIMENLIGRKVNDEAK